MRKASRLLIALVVLLSGTILAPYAAFPSEKIGWQMFRNAYQPTNKLVFLPLLVRNYTPPIPVVMPDDPYFELQWGLHNTGDIVGIEDADVDAPEAWGYNTGSSEVIVAILDSGVDLGHPEFSGRLTAGYDYANEDNDPSDDHGHGTHVAGIVAASGNNGIGVAGTAWGVRIMPLKVLDEREWGYYSMWIQGINYAINNGAQIINMSLVGISYSQALQDAVTSAYNNGVLVVAAAGNCGDQNYEEVKGCDYQDQPQYPAAHDHVLAVASTTPTDEQSSFSNQGNYVDVAAPGSAIFSTGWVDDQETDCTSGFCIKSGTSMAAPFVAGLAALIYSEYPHYSPDQVAQAIVQNVDDLGQSGWDEVYGCGRMNAFTSLAKGASGNGCPNWSGLSTNLDVTPSVKKAPPSADFRPGVLLVKFKDTSSATAQKNLLNTYGLRTLDTISGLDIHLIAVPEGEELVFVDKLNESSLVAYAELDYKISLP